MIELLNALDFSLLTWECIGAAGAVYVTTRSFVVNRKISFFNMLAGAGSWLIYSLFSSRWQYFGSVFLSSVFVSLWAQVGARKFKVPVTPILIPSLYTMVPGIPIYQAVNAFLSDRLFEAGAYASKALMMAFAVALGIGIVQSFVTFLRKTKERVNEKKKIKQKEGII